MFVYNIYKHIYWECSDMRMLVAKSLRALFAKSLESRLADTTGSGFRV